jgi:hypothetical protein
MPVTRWMALIGVVVGIGFAQVAQRNAVYLNSYRLGERLRQQHAQETEIGWLRAQVIGLTSPAGLARAADTRQLKLVAWSTVTGQGHMGRLAAGSAGRSSQDGPGGAVRVASLDADQADGSSSLTDD